MEKVMSPYQLWRRRIFDCLSLALLLQALSMGSAQPGAAPGDKVTTAYTTIGGIITPFWISYEKGIF
jgi:hypothetical protein